VRKTAPVTTVADAVSEIEALRLVRIRLTGVVWRGVLRNYTGAMATEAGIVTMLEIVASREFISPPQIIPTLEIVASREFISPPQIIPMLEIVASLEIISPPGITSTLVVVAPPRIVTTLIVVAPSARSLENFQPSVTTTCGHTNISIPSIPIPT